MEWKGRFMLCLTLPMRRINRTLSTAYSKVTRRGSYLPQWGRELSSQGEPEFKYPALRDNTSYNSCESVTPVFGAEAGQGRVKQDRAGQSRGGRGG